jgi:ABC-type multidrug transport system fused ATPase/permease subunit
VAENIRYSRPDASDADLARAIDAAGLAAFVASLPDGLATIVGERGLALSAGERHRLALARALLATPAILVLDEPTAALDPLAEQAALRGIDEAARGRTTILITHRLDLARTADLVLVLDGARIVESGPPERLLAQAGRFASMFRRDATAAP